MNELNWQSFLRYNKCPECSAHYWDLGHLLKLILCLNGEARRESSDGKYDRLENALLASTSIELGTSIELVV